MERPAKKSVHSLFGRKAYRRHIRSSSADALREMTARVTLSQLYRHETTSTKESTATLISTPSTESSGEVGRIVYLLPHISLRCHIQERQLTDSIIFIFISYHQSYPASQSLPSHPSHHNHCFFSPPRAFCTLPPTAPSGLKFLPIMPSLASGPPTFSPTLPMAPSLVKAPPMVPFASKAGAFWSEGV